VEPHNPQHPPMVMVTWQAEGNAGKKTIIVDFKSEEGKKVAFDLVSTHHMFSRILNCLLIKITFILAFYNLF
jgi:crotonobetainyl-CoA:carnitine CoA-transferase CaiB-like acyl-CoA transferase